jgi:HTH-type transcriptional regulator, transcriptional repressor of NAD biosynthesis genes
MTRGLVLGKFLPPHAGHLYLVEVARHLCDELTVVVGTLAREPIPGALRHRWMTELCPGARVVHLTDENPQLPEEHPDFWAIWRTSLLGALGTGPTHVFASEAYGERLAAELGAQFVPVDPARAALPVSGTAIRRDPWAQWRYLPRIVRPYFLRRICVFGPESTGKTTLATRLAAHYGTVAVPEYARAYLEARRGRLETDDIDAIGRGQIAVEEALALEADRRLICDTDALTTCVWSEALFGRVSGWLAAAADRSYDLTLLCDVDVPWIADPVRYLPHERASFFARCEQALRDRGRRYVVVRGSWDERFAAACRAIDAIGPPVLAT